MQGKKVISHQNMPSRLPVTRTVVLMLAMDVWSTPGWAKGVIWTLLSLIWIGCVISIWREKYIDIFKENK